MLQQTKFSVPRDATSRANPNAKQRLKVSVFIMLGEYNLVLAPNWCYSTDRQTAFFNTISSTSGHSSRKPICSNGLLETLDEDSDAESDEKDSASSDTGAASDEEFSADEAFIIEEALLRKKKKLLEVLDEDSDAGSDEKDSASSDTGAASDEEDSADEAFGNEGAP